MNSTSFDPAATLDFGDDDPTTSRSPAAQPVPSKPTTPDGRIDRWHRKLLDLTLRNRLLNFKSTKQTIPFLCSEVSKLEDRLANGEQLKLVSLPDAKVTAGADVPPGQVIDQRQLELEFSKAALDRNEVCATIGGEELSKRLTTLYRSSRNDLAEGGSNTLHLAVGFLRWKEKPGDTRSFRAPLLLVPAKLLRKSANSAYRLAHHEDDVRFNATLIQKLKRDFDCDLSQFENELPTDERGVDVPKVLERVRHQIGDKPGFEVVDETALGSFSFAKYLMWKDLVERSDQLERNRVVRHLVRNPELAFQADTDTSIPDAEEMDRFEPADLIHPLDADSSQLAAVMAAAAGHDFVLVGPPGTGKSQTIANIIAQCLANEKTVLFVAEKTAALDVVQRRLQQNGLGDFCVELHSNKAERKRFLRQLDQAWQNGRRKRGTHWDQINDDLKRTRDQLNAYVKALHRNEHDEPAYQRLTAIADDIALTFNTVRDQPSLDAITKTKWSMGWEQKLLDQSQRMTEAIGRQDASRLCKAGCRKSRERFPGDPSDAA